MSVINAMLQKLDQRGAARPASAPAAPAISTATVVPRAAPAGWRMPLIVALGGAAIGAAAFADWPRALGVGASNAAAAPPQPAAMAAGAARGDAGAETPALAGRPASAPATAPVVMARAAPRAERPAAALALPASLATPIPLPRIDKRGVEAPAAQRAAALHRAATELAQAGHARGALERVREALAADASHQPSRLLAALLEYETGATERALVLLRDGLARQPDEPAMALLLARLLAASGATEQALATLERHRLDDAPAQGLRAGLLAQAGDYRSALGAYESAARQEPANPMWWFGLGVALDAQGDGARARARPMRAPRPSACRARTRPPMPSSACARSTSDEIRADHSEQACGGLRPIWCVRQCPPFDLRPELCAARLRAGQRRGSACDAPLRGVRCGTRPGVAPHNSLRSLRSLHSNTCGESVDEARCARRPQGCVPRRRILTPALAGPQPCRDGGAPRTAHGALLAARPGLGWRRARL